MVSVWPVMMDMIWNKASVFIQFLMFKLLRVLAALLLTSSLKNAWIVRKGGKTQMENALQLQIFVLNLQATIAVQNVYKDMN